MKYFRIIIMSDGSKAPIQLSLNSSLIRFVLVAFVGFVVLNLGLLGWNLWHFSDSLKVAHLRKERTSLEMQFATLRSYTDSLAAELERISQKNNTLLELTGVPIPERGYAVGGRNLKAIDSTSFAQRMAFEIDSLRFVAQQEAKAICAVEEKLTQREKILRHTPSISPMRGFVSSGFGKRIDPITGTWRMHEGIDICAPKGTPVYATADGRVKFAGWERGFGKVVTIDHIWYVTRYAHLDEILVRVGQKVKRGDVIGKCGRTGRTTGTHLHYEVRVAGKPVNPKDYILPQRICVD